MLQNEPFHKNALNVLQNRQISKEDCFFLCAVLPAWTAGSADREQKMNHPEKFLERVYGQLKNGLYHV